MTKGAETIRKTRERMAIYTDEERAELKTEVEKLYQEFQEYEQQIKDLAHYLDPPEERPWSVDVCCLCSTSAECQGTTEEEAAKDLYNQGWRNLECEYYSVVGLMCPGCIPHREKGAEHWG